MASPTTDNSDGSTVLTPRVSTNMGKSTRVWSSPLARERRRRPRKTNSPNPTSIVLIYHDFCRKEDIDERGTSLDSYLDSTQAKTNDGTRGRIILAHVYINAKEEKSLRLVAFLLEIIYPLPLLLALDQNYKTQQAVSKNDPIG